MYVFICLFRRGFPIQYKWIDCRIQFYSFLYAWHQQLYFMISKSFILCLPLLQHFLGPIPGPFGYFFLLCIFIYTVGRDLDGPSGVCSCARFYRNIKERCTETCTQFHESEGTQACTLTSTAGARSCKIKLDFWRLILASCWILRGLEDVNVIRQTYVLLQFSL